MVSINDVAQKANVSISTVSRVINQSVNVSKEKKKAVLKAVEELDYIPNGLAQGLVTKNTNSIGILIADISNMYYSSLVKSIESTLKQKGYYTIIGNTEWDAEREKDYFRYFIQKQVDGFIFASTLLNDKTIQRFSSKGTPIIVLDREINSKGVDKIRINDYEGAYKATEHLVNCNYDYFIHLKGPKNATTAIDRSRAFKRCLIDNHVSEDNFKILFGQFTENKAREHISKFLDQFKLKGRRIGVFAANDATAFGILKEVKARGIKIPEQLGVVGFDDVNFASYTCPPLTTVNRPISEIGKMAANMIVERIEQKETRIVYKKNITMEVNLIKRGSTVKL